jgi:hypothetical protein
MSVKRLNALLLFTQQRQFYRNMTARMNKYFRVVYFMKNLHKGQPLVCIISKAKTVKKLNLRMAVQLKTFTQKYLKEPIQWILS